MIQSFIRRPQMQYSFHKHLELIEKNFKQTELKRRPSKFSIRVLCGIKTKTSFGRLLYQEFGWRGGGRGNKSYWLNPQIDVSDCTRQTLG